MTEVHVTGNWHARSFDHRWRNFTLRISYHTAYLAYSSRQCSKWNRKMITRWYPVYFISSNLRQITFNSERAIPCTFLNYINLCAAVNVGSENHNVFQTILERSPPSISAVNISPPLRMGQDLGSRHVLS